MKAKTSGHDRGKRTLPRLALVVPDSERGYGKRQISKRQQIRMAGDPQEVCRRPQRSHAEHQRDADDALAHRSDDHGTATSQAEKGDGRVHYFGLGVGVGDGVGVGTGGTWSSIGASGISLLLAG